MHRSRTLVTRRLGLAEELSFTAAAARLHVTQQVLSG
jgi:DNA-binding transcriptional LysR family regulator